MAASDPIDLLFGGMDQLGPGSDASTVAEAAGYRVLGTERLPRDAWVTGYYAVLEPRARGLGEHPDASVRAMVEETLWEIEVFEQSGDAYGYVLYLLRRGAGAGDAA